jgi:hypothetical protein
MALPYTQCGKRGGIVWQRNRYGQIHYPWHKPRDPKSPAQRFVRLNFGEVSLRWRRLTEPQRLRWCAAAREQKSRRRLGQRYPLRGYYYYMRVNVALANRGQPLLELPPEEPQPAGLSLPLLTSVWYGQPGPLLALCVRAKPQLAGPAPPPSG